MYVDVQVLGILVIAEIGQHRSRPSRPDGLGRNQLNDLEDPPRDLLVS